MTYKTFGKCSRYLTRITVGVSTSRQDVEIMNIRYWQMNNKQQISEVFKQLHIKLSEQQVNRIMENFDASGDGQIQFDEFLQVIAAHFAQPQSEEWIFQVFETIDQDGDGLLSKHELMKVVKLYGLEIEEKDIDLVMELGDQHGEGGLSYEQFAKLIKIQ